MAFHAFEFPGVPNATPEMFVHIPQPRLPTFRDIGDGNDYVPIGFLGHQIPERIRPDVSLQDERVYFSLPGIPEFGVALGDNLAEVGELIKQGVPHEHRTAAVKGFTLERTATNGIWRAIFELPNRTPSIDRIDELCLGALVNKYVTVARERLPQLDKGQ